MSLPVRTGPTPGCDVCAKDGWEDCCMHERCEGDYCEGDDHGEASRTRLSELGCEDTGFLTLGPICRSEYKRRAKAHADHEAGMDRLASEHKERYGW